MLVFGMGQGRKQGRIERFMIRTPLRRKFGGSFLNRTLDRRQFRRNGTMGFGK